jgi:peptidoglycan hydrolase-like protein with peptidoglycan-binding domain
VLDLLVPPPPPPDYHRRHYRSSSNAGDSSVARVQSALRKRGYYSGAIDGDAGRGTRAAIRSFREENGLGSSTGIDRTLLRALGL